MPAQDGFYEQLTTDEIRSALEGELQVEFGQNIDLTESSVFTTLASVLATVLHDNQEQSLQDVYESAFLDTAVGKALDDVVAIIGIQRREAIHATGVERFSATGPVTQDYPIQSGTTIQTGGEFPSEFETTEPTALELIDSFEDGNIGEYSGDTGNASVVADTDALAAWLDGRDDVVIESHLAHLFDADRVVVLRCHPNELAERLRERGESDAKIRENAEAEALDVVLSETVAKHGRDRVYEVDTTGRDPAEVAAAVAAVIADEREPSAGTVDFTGWL